MFGTVRSASSYALLSPQVPPALPVACPGLARDLESLRNFEVGVYR